MSTLPAINGLTSSTTHSNLFGIQGAPNSGKTTAACSFPNPIFADFDKKLPPGVQCIPFWDDTFVESLGCARVHPDLANRRDGFLKWLRTEAIKIPADYTLVLDSWTRLQDSFDQAAFLNPRQPMYLTKGGKDQPPEHDKFKVFQHRIDWSTQVLLQLQALACPVVITFHEQIERDKDGDPTGKMRPVMMGQFADRIAAYCGMLVRQNVQTSTGGAPQYTWQVRSDNKFNAIVSPKYDLSKLPPQVLAIDITAGAWQKLQQLRKQ